MARSIEELESAWRAALEQENAATVEALVREILTEHAETSLASELRYNRGVLTLTEGEGFGNERLARALEEFKAGAASGEKAGEKAEPWRSLNRTQIAACLARLGNIPDAVKELKAVSDYRPRSTAGLGALTLLAELLEDDKPREAKRYATQKISYARALVRETKETPEWNQMRLLLALELLGSEYAKEGEKLMQELGGMSQDELGEDLYEEVQAHLQG